MAIAQVPSQVITILAAKTYDASWFPGATVEAQIQNAINRALADGALYVYISASMYPYNCNLVSFSTAVHMIREGNIADVWDYLAYGCRGNGLQDDTAGINAALAGMTANFSGNLWLPAGNYNWNTT